MTAFSWQWFELTVDTAVKSLLLAAIVATVIWLFKLRNSHVRHRLWTGVLAAMLTLPLLSPIVPQLRLPISVPQRWLSTADEDTPVLDNAQRVASKNTQTAAASPGTTSQSHLQDSVYPPRFEMEDEQVLPSSTNALSTDNRAAPDSIAQLSATLPTTNAATAAPLARAVPSYAMRMLQRGPFWLGAVWLTGAAVMLMRLLFGLLATWRLGRVSSVITAEELQDLGVSESCWTSNVRSTLLECPLIRVPLTLGLFRPVVLLPAEWLEWSTEKLEVVLLHERMHVERRDSAIAFLSEFNVTVNWLNPLSWWLRQRLSLLAEEACDDAAIVSTGDRTTYARHLLEVAAAASASRGRVFPATVSMARRSNVESRINAILDFTRPLSQRPTWATTLLILLLSGPIIALAAALAPGRSASKSIAAEPLANAKAAAADDIDSTKAVAQAQPATEQKPEAKPEQKPEPTSLLLRGRIVDPAGKAVTGAVVMIRRTVTDKADDTQGDVREVAQLTSAANGEFEHQFASNDFSIAGGRNRRPDMVYVIATKSGYGMAIDASWNWMEPKSLDVSLTVPEPIRGKLLDAEGRPVAGASVRVVDVYGSTTSDVDQWLQRVLPAGKSIAKGSDMAMQQAARAGQYPPGELHDAPIAEGLISTQAAADGTFELQGIGRDQRAVLQVSADKLAVSVLDVIARPMAPVRVAPRFGGSSDANRVFNGSQFSCVIETGFDVTGRLTDNDSGQPIAGAEVIGRLDINWDTRRGQLETKTDADGRYHLKGLAWSGDNGLEVAMPDLPYLGTSFVRVRRPAGADPATVDLKFKRVVWASGRVTDVQTGKPVVGSMFYTPFANNEFVKLHPSYSTGSQKMLDHYPSGRTDAAGRFRIPVIQGRGIICFLADNEGFAPEAGREKIPEFADPLKTPQVTIDHGVPTGFHAVNEVNPAADSTDVTVDLQPDSGRSITLHLIDPEGKPVNGAKVTSLKRSFQLADVKGSDAILEHARIGEVRRLEFLNDTTGDRATVMFRPMAGQTEATIQLLPPGRIIGRLVNPDGRPIENATIETSYKSTGNFTSTLSRSPVTDKQGRFSQEVTAGEKYTIQVDRVNHYNVTLRRDLVTEPGETIDIGDFEVDFNSKANDAKSLGSEKRSKEPWRKGATAANAEGTKPAAVADKSVDADAFHYAGTVADEAGKPVEGAKVTLAYWQPAEDKPKQGNSVVTDGKGQFELTYRRSDFTKFQEDKPWTYSQLVATKKGYGFAAGPLGQFETTGKLVKEMPAQAAEYWKKEGWLNDRKLTLCADVPIRGRIVDTEGRPVAGALLEPLNSDEGKTGSLDAWESATKQPGATFYTCRDQLRRLFGYDYTGGPLDRTLPSTKTDADGFFTLEGVGRERLVSVILSGRNIESSMLRLRSRDGQVIKIDSSSDADRMRFLSYYPNGSTYIAGPSQPVSGVVTDLKTGKPITGAFTYAESTASYDVGGSAGFIRSTTDQNGHYVLKGFPPGTNRFVIVPPIESGNLPAGVEINTALASEPVVKNVALLSGVRARGIVKEAVSGKPIRGYVRYFAFSSNPALKELDGARLTDLRTHFRTDASGKFEIPVLPGPGLITVSTHDHFTYPRGAGADKITHSEGEKGSGLTRLLRTQPHLVSPINFEGLIPIEPSADSPAIDVSLTLTALQSFPGRVLAQDNSVIEQYILHGALTPGGWYQQASTTFEVKGYLPAEGRRLMAYAPQADAIGLLDVTNEPPALAEIKLQPASRIAGRLIDAEGQPIAGARIENERRSRILASPLAAEAAMRGKFDPDGAEFVTIGSQRIVTDDQGRFELIGIMPGLKYSARVFTTQQKAGRTSTVLLGSLFTDVVTKPGEKRDLGDVKAKTTQQFPD